MWLGQWGAKRSAPSGVAHATPLPLSSRARAAVAGSPVTDTVKRVKGGVVVETVPRHDLFAAATPLAARLLSSEERRQAAVTSSEQALLLE